MRHYFPQRETLDDYFRNTQIMKTKQVIFKTKACERLI